MKVVSTVNERYAQGEDGAGIEDIACLLSQVAGGIYNHVPRDGNHVAHHLTLMPSDTERMKQGEDDARWRLGYGLVWDKKIFSNVADTRGDVQVLMTG
ncbi:hypothetical protein TIFTF001_038635 [Ficus carica]|uniref:Uncharacterized protein n=1 Tax=Ficus carica TaxID=3494 RepID=A0AA88JA49_FICCA|nr:hypothetical protein TIFTF001_038623 [Ficus carica]GMN69579.1 hypothetical protein TIFTF001_038626 [Ficus carica]GMN69585.1 hypothetical protein TIFTF001_038632 [Ficus carica]GMN69588.1 hypothetical protein TIFTF001_038635 [Ficus carica]